MPYRGSAALRQVLIYSVLALALSLVSAVPAHVAADEPPEGTWRPLPNTGAPSPGSGPAVWTGSELVVWGGWTGKGGRYNPAADTWAPISSTGAPTPRAGTSMVWTGHEVLIWGGDALPGDNRVFGDGARYDPATDSWRPMSSVGAPSPRSAPAAVWTGHELLVWGGDAADGNRAPLGDGAAYDPATDTWRALPTDGAPSPRKMAAAVWTGREAIISGGANPKPLRDGASFDPIANTWSPISSTGAPPSWWGGQAVWAENRMLVWGGLSLSNQPAMGGSYDPQADIWRPITSVGAPPASSSFTPVWTGRELLVWGGCCAPGDAPYDGGGRYDPTSDTWAPMTTVGAAQIGYGYVAVWTGQELLTWGGGFWKYSFNTGGRYIPPCRYTLGFAALHAAIPATVGDCLEDEQHNPTTGDGLQHTANGLLVWRRADNFTAFTDGYHTWVIGPNGVQERLNTQRFTWEANPGGQPYLSAGRRRPKGDRAGSTAV